MDADKIKSALADVTAEQDPTLKIGETGVVVQHPLGGTWGGT